MFHRTQTWYLRKLFCVCNEDIRFCRHNAFHSASSQSLPWFIKSLSPGLLDVWKRARRRPRRMTNFYNSCERNGSIQLWMSWLGISYFDTNRQSIINDLLYKNIPWHAKLIFCLIRTSICQLQVFSTCFVTAIGCYFSLLWKQA